jgi:predicted nucleic acid-binding protein
VIVADTNLVAYALIEGERTPAARRVWERDRDWRLPPLWRSEFLNVLARLVLAGDLAQEDAVSTWWRAADLFGAREVEPYAEDVLRAALRHGISAYDAHFVVVATELGCPLVTADREVLAACPGVAISLESFGAGR